MNEPTLLRLVALDALVGATVALLSALLRPAGRICKVALLCGYRECGTPMRSAERGDDSHRIRTTNPNAADFAKRVAGRRGSRLGQDGHRIDPNELDDSSGSIDIPTRFRSLRIVPVTTTRS